MTEIMKTEQKMQNGKKCSISLKKKKKKKTDTESCWQNVLQFSKIPFCCYQKFVNKENSKLL